MRHSEAQEGCKFCGGDHRNGERERERERERESWALLEHIYAYLQAQFPLLTSFCSKDKSFHNISNKPFKTREGGWDPPSWPNNCKVTCKHLQLFPLGICLELLLNPLIIQTTKFVSNIACKRNTVMYDISETYSMWSKRYMSQSSMCMPNSAGDSWHSSKIIRADEKNT